MRMSLRKRIVLVATLVVVALCFAATAVAQEVPASKVDIYGGYAWADPGSHSFTIPQIKNIRMHPAFHASNHQG